MAQPTQKSLVFTGEYSEASVAVLANILPMPMPLIKRMNKRCSTDWAKMVLHTHTPMILAESKIMALRPIMSAFEAKNIAPIAIPNSPALNTKPNFEGSTAHSLAMEGAV